MDNMEYDIVKLDSIEKIVDGEIKGYEVNDFYYNVLGIDLDVIHGYEGLIDVTIEKIKKVIDAIIKFIKKIVKAIANVIRKIVKKIKEIFVGKEVEEKVETAKKKIEEIKKKIEENSIDVKVAVTDYLKKAKQANIDKMKSNIRAVLKEWPWLTFINQYYDDKLLSDLGIVLQDLVVTGNAMFKVAENIFGKLDIITHNFNEYKSFLTVGLQKENIVVGDTEYGLVEFMEIITNLYGMYSKTYTNIETIGILWNRTPSRGIKEYVNANLELEENEVALPYYMEGKRLDVVVFKFNKAKIEEIRAIGEELRRPIRDDILPTPDKINMVVEYIDRFLELDTDAVDVRLTSITYEADSKVIESMIDEHDLPTPEGIVKAIEKFYMVWTEHKGTRKTIKIRLDNDEKDTKKFEELSTELLELSKTAIDKINKQEVPDYNDDTKHIYEGYKRIINSMVKLISYVSKNHAKKIKIYEAYMKALENYDNIIDLIIIMTFIYGEFVTDYEKILIEGYKYVENNG